VKGIVLAGGLGTRLSPLTKITNKHLLPVYDRPMIYYPLQTLVNAGISDIMVVTGGYAAGEFLRLLGNGSEFGLKHLDFAYQPTEGGIAEALGLAENFVGSDRMVVMLGDNIIEGNICGVVEGFAAQKAGARIVLKEVEHPEAFGVPAFEDGRIVRIEEKPTSPPSRYAVVGIYCFDPYVWEIIHGLTPSARGELEVTDVNNAYLARRELEYDVLEGWWGDAGESVDSLLTLGMKVREGGANHLDLPQAPEARAS
jgi:glucose-1-phosphate thymidylyltransferase